MVGFLTHSTGHLEQHDQWPLLWPHHTSLEDWSSPRQIDPFLETWQIKSYVFIVLKCLFCLVIVIFIVFNIAHHLGLLGSQETLDFGQTNKKIKLLPKYEIISQNTDSLMPSNPNSRQITLVNLYKKQELFCRRNYLNYRGIKL